MASCEGRVSKECYFIRFDGLESPPFGDVHSRNFVEVQTSMVQRHQFFGPYGDGAYPFRETPAHPLIIVSIVTLTFCKLQNLWNLFLGSNVSLRIWIIWTIALRKSCELFV